MMDSENILKACNHQFWGNPRPNPHSFFKELTDYSSNFDADFYGQGQSVQKFEKKIASYLGKESGLFLPSGTMAQQIAIRVWADFNNIESVGFHHLSHLEVHEQQAIYKLHPHLNIFKIGSKDRLISLDDLISSKLHDAVMLFELPQRELGGQLPEFTELKEQIMWCKENNITTHLDGARLWESIPFYNLDIKEICNLFDSVYVSFYKGLGAIAGAVLVGSENFINQSKIWQRRYGGNIISLYPYYISSAKSFEENIGKMNTFYQRAKDIAKIINSFKDASTIPNIPQSNMFHVVLNKKFSSVKNNILEIAKNKKIKVIPLPKIQKDNTLLFEFSVGNNTMQFSLEEIEYYLTQTIG